MTASIWTTAGKYSVPDFWADKNWQRPYAFLRSVESETREAAHRSNAHRFLEDKITSGFELKRVLYRSSLTKNAGTTIPFSVFSEILRTAYQVLPSHPYLFAGVITQSVEGWKDGYWILDHSPRSIKPTFVDFDEHSVAGMIQGQQWASGPGISFLIGIDWEYARSEADERDAIYAQSLMDVGRAGHALLLRGLHSGLSARMTPAIRESLAAAAFNLGPERDFLYFLKLAYPAAHPGDQP
ncbi:hypothetical protein ACFRJ8_19930 [Arthrobacter sp. NPDC056886]|uniref:hypothetical protein n=1 Tax=Arthrobacter sp. NPDC056886 TaxID=3345960 RepID=UPI00366BC6F3